MARADHQRVRSLLAEAITILCKNCLAYKSEFCVEGLLGITLDNEEVFLVNIKENIQEGGGVGAGADVDVQMVTQAAASMSRPAPSRTYPVGRPVSNRGFATRARSRMRGRGINRFGAGARKHSLQGAVGGPSAKRLSAGNVDSNNIGLAGQSEPITVSLDSDGNSNNAGNSVDNSETDGTSGQVGSSNPHDPLYPPLDFGDMLKQYEDQPNNTDNAAESSSVVRNEDGEEVDIKVKKDSELIVIKPERSPPPSCGDSSEGLPVSSPNSSMIFTQPSSLFASTSSGPVFPVGPGIPSSEMFGPSGQYGASPSMGPGASVWGDQKPPISMLNQMMANSPQTPSPSPRKAPRSSGSGHKGASSSQGSPAQMVPAGKKQCPLCRKNFPTLLTLRVHVATDHTTGKLGSCPMCQQQMAQGSLRRHIDTVHMKQEFKCHICGRKYNRKDNLTSHVSKAHGNQMLNE